MEKLTGIKTNVQLRESREKDGGKVIGFEKVQEVAIRVPSRTEIKERSIRVFARENVTFRRGLN